MNQILFIIDAKNIVIISPECIDETTTINISDSRIKKVRTNYKYDQGAVQFYKYTNYASIY